jgi:phenylacetate-coenzyme A ligase PaaK-like adenylate-forming protein
MVRAADLFEVNSANFKEITLEVFRYQAKNCAVYADYIKFLGRNPDKIDQIIDIPFLPIEFFKTKKVTAVPDETAIIFSSSGTTGMQQSAHYVHDLTLYNQSFQKAFERFYGNPSEIAILALLPSYLERTGSSLIYMVDALIQQSKQPESGYFLHNFSDLHEALLSLKKKGTKTLLIGVTYALLDYIEAYSEHEFPDLIVMETGGMKGRRKEMIREEVHAHLTQGFGVKKIHSEYGMTELLSQAYSDGDGRFTCPPWMKVMIRDTNDPLSYLPQGMTGGINVIDLANLHACSFIATQDLGKAYDDDTFEVLGRFDHSDIRGCNLLIA